MKLEVGVKALIKDSKGRYLFLKRALPYKGEQETRWEIPGGRIKPGEPIFEALAREIKEETGLTMKGKPYILSAQDILRVKDRHVVRLTFQVKAQGKVKLNSKEHSDYQWVKLTDIKNLHYDLYLNPTIEILGT